MPKQKKKLTGNPIVDAMLASEDARSARDRRIRLNVGRVLDEILANIVLGPLAPAVLAIPAAREEVLRNVRTFGFPEEVDLPAGVVGSAA